MTPTLLARPGFAPSPEIDDATRRQFLALLAAGGLLTACSDDDDPIEASPTPSTRQVPSDSGPITVPTEPKRVVAAIGSFEIDMVAVGITPVLTTTFAGPWVDLGPDTKVTENVPPTAEELVLADPDLIVGWTWVTKEPGFDKITAVAPYVGLGESAGSAGLGWDSSVPLKSWDTLFLSVCEAVGRRERGVELVKELEAKIDDLARRRQGLAKVSVARIEFYEAGNFSWRGQNEDTSELMKRIGIEVVGPDQSENEVSLERLPEIDADWLIVPVGGGSMPEDVYAQVSESEIFKRIPAVEAGRVLVVDGALWPGLGYLWAVAMVEELDRLFGSGDPSSIASPSAAPTAS